MKKLQSLKLGNFDQKNIVYLLKNIKEFKRFHISTKINYIEISNIEDLSEFIKYSAHLQKVHLNYVLKHEQT